MNSVFQLETTKTCHNTIPRPGHKIYDEVHLTQEQLSTQKFVILSFLYVN